MQDSILSPVLALICWTFVMWAWMYATRIPAMRRAGLDARTVKEKKELDVLPRAVRQIADNYNHLHEQPVLFYALAFYTHLAGVADPINITLAWLYVVLRVIHSIYQSMVNFVPVRFALFCLASLALFAIAARDVLTLLTA